jgi:hypothetical protein
MIRLLDIIFSFIGLIFFSPFFFIISLLVKFSSAGPVFYQQVRVGLNFKDFYWGTGVPDVFIRKHDDENRISNGFNFRTLSNVYNTYFRIIDELKNNPELQIKFKNNIEKKISINIYNKVFKENNEKNEYEFDNDYYMEKDENFIVGIIDRIKNKQLQYEDVFKMREKRSKVLTKKRGTGITTLKGAVCYNANDKEYLFRLWDTSSNERFIEITRIYFKNAAALILCTDLTNNSWNNLKEIIQILV